MKKQRHRMLVASKAFIAFTASGTVTCALHLLGNQEGFVTNLLFVVVSAILLVFLGEKAHQNSRTPIPFWASFALFVALLTAVSLCGEVWFGADPVIWKVLVSPAISIGFIYPLGDGWLPINFILWTGSVAVDCLISVLLAHSFQCIKHSIRQR